MIFSKSFGYALRGILFVAMESKKDRAIQLDEIANTLNVPRHFMGKVLKRVVKAGVMNSVKGHKGGFSLNEKTLGTRLILIAELTGELKQFETCILHFRSCNGENPCPLHHKVEPLRFKWRKLLATTQIKDLLDTQSSSLLKSIITREP